MKITPLKVSAILCVILAAILSIYFQFFSVNISKIEHSIADDPNNLFGVKRARIALEEYKKGVHNDFPNCNCGVEVEKYSNGTRMPWGGYFVSWVTKEAGAPFEYQKSLAETWHIDNSITMSYYLSENATFHYKTDVIERDLKPKVGDILILEYERKRVSLDVESGRPMIVVEVLPNGNVDAVVGDLYGKVDLVTNFDYRNNASFLGFGNTDKPKNDQGVGK